ncbi:pyrroline-5-carboxylate reductase [Paracoccus aerodenitrificans]|uniref:pyrroline-5-carboxylate reductase n=1 Tax=Paracoccus aerodenitrificans TaxID=3017781 RepID=UPI0022F07531|nr:pyrroline-5-carboxylate reductase [Paracoccus aerodenitrificans]WBU63415.1 pyrroline-5-carboxylate reductase [Paracoccus aerodenitrificans]
MDFSEINRRGLTLIGCGRMGGAMLTGWLANGIRPEAVTVIDPGAKPDWAERGIRLNQSPPDNPAVLVLAVKPQMMQEVLSDLSAGPETLVLSVAAGVKLAAYSGALPGVAIIRAMPNTPAAIGQGITAIIGSDAATEAQMALAENLLSVVGNVVRLTDEGQMDAVTALSGSGPAYVFHMIEALTAAGIAEGLPKALSLQLARATVAGAGALAMNDDTAPSELREAVTSPGGTTAAGLEQLMDAENGLPPLMRRTVAAAARRSQELGA